jgi:Fe-S-cluster containining protein
MQLCHASAKLVQFFHSELDIWKKTTPPVVCKASCAHCCNHWVDGLDTFEILAIYSQIRGKPHFIDTLNTYFEREQLRDLIAEDTIDYEEVLSKYFQSNKSCPHLKEDNICEIYKHRPLICDLYQAKDNPEFCKPKKIINHLENNEIIEIDLLHQKTLAQIDFKLSKLKVPESLFSAILYISSCEKKWTNDHFYKFVE